jgi:osmotically-inducible protein OsmY
MQNSNNRGISLLGVIALIALLLVLGWMTFVVSTRGWDNARNDIQTSFRSVAHAAKETSQTAALTTKVKTALSLSKRIPADKINVDSEGDVVTLRGEVPSEEIRQLAESIARDVPGVSEVRNHLFAVSSTQ